MNGDLEMWAGDTFSQLSTERLLNLDKLVWINDVQYLLHLSQEHHLWEGRGRENRVCGIEYPSHRVLLLMYM